MIRFIRGELVSVEEDRVLVDVGGVGYGIFMSGSSMGLLPPVGNEVKIHTYLNVKEDAMQLFGFLTRDDLHVFKLLIEVNGSGPKGGQAILSVLSPDDLRFAVMSNDVKAISSAPGIGKKIAQRIILELKDKLAKGQLTVSGSETFADGITVIPEDKTAEASAALAVLGYSQQEILLAMKGIDLERLSLEEIIKQCLKKMVKN